MAAILKIRRGTSASPVLTDGELFLNYTTKTIQFKSGSVVSNLLPLDKSISGDIILSGDITASNILLSGDLTARDVRLSGNIYLGDEIANDNIIVQASVSGSLIPSSSNEYDLGSETYKWKNLWVSTGSIDNISLPGSNIVSSSTQISNYGVFAELDGDNLVSSSQQISTYGVFAELNGDNLVSSSAQTISHLEGSGIVSSSAQISGYNTFLEINGDNVVSSSSQISAYNVFLEINGDNVVSSSAQITNGSGIVSSSAQISNYGVFAELNGDNLVSSSQQISDYNTFLEINGDNVVSSSEQVIAHLPSGIISGSTFTNFSSSVDSRLDSIQSYTSSLKQAVDVSGQDLTVYGNLTVQGTTTTLNTTELVIEDKLLSLASGSITSAEADGAGLHISGADVSLTWDDTNSNMVFNTKVSSSVGFKGDGSELTNIQYGNVDFDGSGLVSSSQQISNYNKFLEINGDNVVSSSQQISNYNTFLEINGDGVVSGSNQLTSSLDNRYELQRQNIVSSSAQVISLLPDGVVSGSSQLTSSFDTRYLNTDGDSVISSSAEGSQQGTIELNGVDVNVNGLQTGSSPSFEGVSLTNLSTLSSGYVTALFSGSAGQVGLRTLGTAAFMNVSASVGDDPNSIPTNQAVNNALIAAGAGDLTEFNPTNTFNPNTTGLVHLSSGTEIGGVRGVQGNVHVAIHTGSNHFVNGVISSLPSGVVSGSSQITITESQISDLNHFTIDDLPAGIVSSSAQISGYGIFAELGGDNLVSGSSQIDVNSTQNFQTFSQSVDLRLDNQEGFSSSIDTTIKTKLNIEGVISGSSQITAGSGIVSSSQQISNYNTFLEIDGDNVVSSSIQISNYNKFLEINGDNVVSSSEQIDNLGFLKVNGDGVISGSDQLSSSFDSRYVNVTGDETIGGNKTFSNNVIISGDLNVAGTTTFTSTNNVNIGDNIINLNYGGSATTSGIYTKDATGASTTSGSLLWDATNDYWKSGKKDLEKRIIVEGASAGTANKVSKFDAAGTIINSNITDTGTLITLGTAVDVTGVTNFNNTTESTSKTTGAVIVDGGVGIAKNLNVGGDVIAYASSDRRLKNEIIPISNPIEKINSIGGYSFVWNEEKQNIYKGKDYGVIAQEIEEILPELVNTREDGYKSVKYDRLISLLIEGIKHLSKEVEDLKKNKLS